MYSDERRIRNLKLNGRDHDDLLKARYLLEEAFRTASLAGLPPNAMVLIRRLNLGKIHPGDSSVKLADTISETVQKLAEQAICIDQQPTNDAEVVWFRDPLQPYQLLLQRLLDGRQASEWYWLSLFPNQQLVLNEQLLTQLLIKACQTPIKGLAVSLLVQSCLEPLRITRLMAFLTPVLARRLLHEQGMPPVALFKHVGQRQSEDPSQGQQLQPIDAPSLSLDWRRAIQSVVEQWGHNDLRSRWFALQALLCQRPMYFERRDVWQRIDVGHWLHSWSEAMPVSEQQQNDNVISSTQLSYSELESDEALVKQNFENRLEQNQPLSPQKSLADDPDRNQTQATHLTEENADQTTVALERAGQFSSYAGFAFLIPLFQRLGMSELLQQYGVLSAADFPHQLLRVVAKRFKLDKHDPCWKLFNETEVTPKLIVEQFEAPQQWCQLAQHSHHVSNHFPMTKTTLHLGDLINSFQLLCALYLRRYCHLSLRSLITQPGRIHLSQTHWDVMFDLNQTDLRLRRVALDSDPGWVPWLGQVVQFHYDSEG